MKHLIATTYLTGGVNQSGKHHRSNHYPHIRRWYESMTNAQLKGIIFHDHFTDEFVEKHTNDYVTFIKDEGLPDSGLNPIDYRWFLYHDYFTKNPTDVLFLTDCFDVAITGGYFLSGLEKDKLYIGDEPKLMRQSSWCKRYTTPVYPNYPYWDKQILNCGVVGGYTSLLLPFVADLAGEVKKINANPLHKRRDADMQAVNYVAWNRFKDTDIIHGAPVTSVFKKNQLRRKDVWFIHK